MNLRHLWLILCKELTDTLRDRNAILGFLLAPVFSPLVYGLIFSLIAARVSEESHLVLPVAGSEHAPALVQWLGQQTGVTVIPAPADAEVAVHEGRLKGLLVIGSDFPSRLRRGLPAPITLVNDSRRGESERFAARVRDLVGAYAADVAAARLTLRGIDPRLASPVKLDALDLATAHERNGAILSFLPMLLMWMALIGGMPLALDSTAGERERASLEPLLLNPISSTSLIAGKWLAAALLASLGLLLAAGSSVLVLRFIPWHDLGMQMHVTDRALGLSVLMMLPVALLMSSAVMLVSALSKSFQQAQSYSGVLMIAALVPGILTVVLPVIQARWTLALPIVGQLSITRDILTGSAPDGRLPIVAVLGTLLPAFLLIALAARLVRRETIVFRGE